MVECKFEKLAIDELETMYKNVSNFTSLCLEKVSRILDVSQNWLPLADLLDLKHFLHTNMFVQSKSKSRELLQIAVVCFLLFRSFFKFIYRFIFTESN